MMDAGLAIEVAVKGVLVLSAACVMYALMRRYAASQRHLVLAVAMLGVLLIPLFAVALPNVTVPIRAHAIESDTPVASQATRIAPPTRIEPVPSVSRPIDRPGTIATAAQEFVTTSKSGPAFTWTSALAVVWAVGFVVCLIPLVVGLAGIRAVRRSGRALVDPEWTGALRAGRVGLGVTMPVVLIESPRARVPMTWGLFRGYIALPESARDWSPQRRQVVLCHELAHIKRRDFLTQLIARVACAAHWFNPLGWWALRAMSLERERACDDLVVESGVRAPDYAEHLLQIVRDMRGASFTARTAIAMAGHSRLEQRVRALLDATQKRRALSGGAHVMTAGAVLACVAFVAMLQPTAVAEEPKDGEERTVIVIDTDKNDDRDVRVIRKVRGTRTDTDTEFDGEHGLDLDALLEHISDALRDVDIEAAVEEALKSLDREDVQRHVDEAVREIERVDVNAEIEQAIEEIESIELSEEDVRELRENREEIRHELRKVREHLRDGDIQKHLDEVRRELKDVDIDAHIGAALGQFSQLQQSPEWEEAFQAIHEVLGEVDFEAIGKAVGQKLEELDIEPVMEAALMKVDEIDVVSLADRLNERIEDIDVVLEPSPSEYAAPESRDDVAALVQNDDLRRVNLHQAKLRGMNLSGKDLRGALLAGADLREANLEGADLRNADLRGANLREANLRDAKLVGARLDGANLRDSDLTGVFLRGVDLNGADTRGTKKSAFAPIP